jgi:hypothetical protein
MAAMCALAKHRPPSDIHVHQFGSPPVLAHKDGGGGHKVLEVGVGLCLVLEGAVAGYTESNMTEVRA